MKGFDTFLMEKHCKSFAGEQEERRRETYRILNKKLKGRKVASYSTLQSWLGLKKKTMPDREHIFRLAFALELTYEELEEYLQKGALLPGVQINDYQEIIWIYGLENHLSWDECQDMIQVFEAHICQDVVIEQKTHTDKLWSYYGEWNQLSPEKFLKEMYKQAGMFKGYGKTALKYFVAYKNEILECVRKEAMESLIQELESVGFYEWARENSIEEWEYKEAVLRYVKNETRRKAPPDYKGKVERNRALLLESLWDSG